jgi:DNA-binding NtrC family response regulator
MLPGVLLIEDEATLAKNIRSYLSRQGFDVRVAPDGRTGFREFGSFNPDIVLLDYNLPDTDGLQLLERLKAVDPAVNVVMITGEGGVDVAVAAMKAGVRDYLAKPLVLDELRLLLQRIAGEERLQGMLRYYKGREPGGGGLDALLGESSAMRELKNRLRQLLDSDALMTDSPPASVLVSGETGTGKELVARALHLDGPRREQAFIEFNCAAIPTTLLESELFGYEKGAFTDARARKHGLIETAHGGTLFLDEIGDIEPVAQSKLLMVL